MPYCTRTDVESLWNPSQVLSAVDDDANGSLSSAEEQWIDDAIERAAAQLDAVLEVRYDLIDLQANRWCRDANAIFAAYFLAARKSETMPVGLAALFGWYRESLREISASRQNVPGL